MSKITMSADVTREEFEARVGVLEREVEGEKMVTRYILEQSRRNGDDLATLKTRLDRIEGKLEGVDLKGLVRTVAGLDRKIDDLIKSLPRIVAEAVRNIDRNDRKR